MKTDFGWHIIKLEDRKKGQAQPYDQVKGAIRNVLVRQKVNETLASLKDVAKVEILDEDLKKLADEAAKQRQQLLDQQKKKATTGTTDGNNAGGKGDLIAPEEGSPQQ